MEGITEGVNSMSLGVDTQKKNRIQVSHTKKPLFFYVNLAKVQNRYLRNDVLSLEAMDSTCFYIVFYFCVSICLNVRPLYTIWLCSVSVRVVFFVQTL